MKFADINRQFTEIVAGYCCRWTHHETNRNMKRKFKGHDKD